MANSTHRRRFVAVGIGAVVLLGAGALYLLLQDHKGGPTADAVAKEIQKSSDCPTSREDTADNVFKNILPGGGANEVVRVTCDGGELGPVAVIFRFDSASQATAAIPRRRGLTRRDKICLVGSDVVTASVDESFVRFCNAIGGRTLPALTASRS